ncbi:hypothetical protein BOH78_1011 [Pichia kudriavzevii]|uniref:Uncharacterized protein n=1 Tax=Pichia kudriavzevii TaxID=4909 RepID=A0A099NR22_PICKU|nr:hypothetical protein JL09_g6338 [Pichia kudriavzevii]ONH76895.1 hypothetical protein BOH78_1011 [Pichia kudriavzevii]
MSFGKSTFYYHRKFPTLRRKEKEDTIFKLEIKSRVKGITKMKGNIGVEVCGTV